MLDVGELYAGFDHFVTNILKLSGLSIISLIKQGTVRILSPYNSSSIL